MSAWPTAPIWRLPNEVAQAVDVAFRSHDIEIPFPQRVLYSGDTSKDDSNDGAATAN